MEPIRCNKVLLGMLAAGESEEKSSAECATCRPEKADWSPGVSHGNRCTEELVCDRVTRNPGLEVPNIQEKDGDLCGAVRIALRSAEPVTSVGKSVPVIV